MSSRLVFGQHLLPEIAGAHIVIDRRVAGAVVMAAVKGQKDGRFAFQLGGHEDLVRVNGEMDQAALLEGKEQLLGVALVAVLSFGVLHVLAGHGVFEFQADHRQPVDGQHHIGDGAAARLHLAHDGEPVLRRSAPAPAGFMPVLGAK